MAIWTWSFDRTCTTSAVITWPACSTIPVAAVVGAVAVAAWIFGLIVIAMIHRQEARCEASPRVVNLSLTEPRSIGLSGVFVESLQNAGRCLEIDQFRGLPGHDFLVHAPFLGVPVLIDMGRGPGLVGSDHPMKQRQSKQRRSGDGRDHMQRRDGPGIGRQCAPRSRDGLIRLANMHHALGE